MERKVESEGRKGSWEGVKGDGAVGLCSGEEEEKEK